jgi:methyltransferase (TIGR00027 family)
MEVPAFGTAGAAASEGAGAAASDGAGEAGWEAASDVGAEVGGAASAALAGAGGLADGCGVAEATGGWAGVAGSDGAAEAGSELEAVDSGVAAAAGAGAAGAEGVSGMILAPIMTGTFWCGVASGGLGGAIARALHQSIDDQPLVLADPIAPLLIDTDSERYKGHLARPNDPLFKRARSGAVARSRYAEDCLAEAARHGVRQYIVLGAGMDTFAYRQPPWARSLQIFEVDHPATQAWKKKRLELAGVSLPANLTFVPVNFESDPLQEQLRLCGLDASAPAFCSWLGVTAYLTDEAIDRTLRIIRGLPSGSEVVFTFNLPLDTLSGADAELAAAIEANAARLGEPLISHFRPNEMRSKLLDLGFSQAILFDPDQVDARYFRGRQDGLRASTSRNLMRAVV